MARDTLVKFCGACGQADNYVGFTQRVKVPAFVNAFGRVPGWYALACSDKCANDIRDGIKVDQAAQDAQAARWGIA